jgi:hypothetical protein
MRSRTTPAHCRDNRHSWRKRSACSCNSWRKSRRRLRYRYQFDPRSRHPAERRRCRRLRRRDHPSMRHRHRASRHPFRRPQRQPRLRSLRCLRCPRYLPCHHCPRCRRNQLCPLNLPNRWRRLFQRRHRYRRHPCHLSPPYQPSLLSHCRPSRPCRHRLFLRFRRSRSNRQSFLPTRPSRCRQNHCSRRFLLCRRWCRRHRRMPAP